MGRNRWLRLLAVLFAFGLVAAACGDSDDSGTTDSGDSGDSGDSTTSSVAGDDDTTETTAPTTDDGTSETTAPAEDDDGDDGAAGGVTPSTATSLDELEALWESERQAIIDELTAGIESGELGVDADNILHGPSGVEVDLNDCPSDWDPLEGVSDTTIRIGHPGPQSGNLAFYGDISLGWDTYNQGINDAGGIDGRSLEMVRIDDAYVASQTIEAVDQLLQAEDVFSITTMGSPNSLAVYDTINAACVPSPMTITGHPAWGDPVNHPWTTGHQMSYSTEAILWGAWIENNLADQAPVSVSALVMDNDFGLAYEEGFAAVAEASDVIGDFSIQRHDPAAPTVTNEMTTIAGQNPDVFISMTAGTPCTLAIQEAGRNGLIDTAKALFTPSVCTGVEAVMAPGGEASDGWYAVNGGLKGGTDPQYRDEPFWANFRSLVEDAGLDVNVDLLYDGAQRGWTFEQMTRIASALPDGLNRPNFLLAMWSLDMTHPALLDGITFAVDGTNDAYFTEGSQYTQFDAAAQSFIQQGDVIDLNGESSNCAWDTANGGCK